MRSYQSISVSIFRSIAANIGKILCYNVPVIIKSAYFSHNFTLFFPDNYIYVHFFSNFFIWSDAELNSLQDAMNSLIGFQIGPWPAPLNLSKKVWARSNPAVFKSLFDWVWNVSNWVRATKFFTDIADFLLKKSWKFHGETSNGYWVRDIYVLSLYLALLCQQCEKSDFSTLRSRYRSLRGW